jgi:hypothetical protein
MLMPLRILAASKIKFGAGVDYRRPGSFSHLCVEGLHTVGGAHSMPKTPPQTSLQGLTGGGWHSSFFGGVGDGETFSDSELSAASMNGNDPAS